MGTTGIHGRRRYTADEYGYEWLRPESIPLTINKGRNLRLWKSAMDCSCLERLELTQMHLPTFKHIRYMSWESAWNKEAVTIATMVAREQRRHSQRKRRLPRLIAVARMSLASRVHR